MSVRPAIMGIWVTMYNTRYNHGSFFSLRHIAQERQETRQCNARAEGVGKSKIDKSMMMAKPVKKNVRRSFRHEKPCKKPVNWVTAIFFTPEDSWEHQDCLNYWSCSQRWMSQVRAIFKIEVTQRWIIEKVSQTKKEGQDRHNTRNLSPSCMHIHCCFPH